MNIFPVARCGFAGHQSKPNSRQAHGFTAEDPFILVGWPALASSQSSDGLYRMSYHWPKPPFRPAWLDVRFRPEAG
jgi:hypothetical protein